MATRKVIRTDRAAAAVGPYSQAIAAAGWIWVSGQIALDPDSGRMLEGTIEDETRQVLKNLSAVLEAAGSGPDRVVKATIYLTDLGNFESVNRVYAEFFAERPPARACVEVSGVGLPTAPFCWPAGRVLLGAVCEPGTTGCETPYGETEGTFCQRHVFGGEPEELNLCLEGCDPVPSGCPPDHVCFPMVFEDGGRCTFLPPVLTFW